jgi:hypothetical protein
MGGEDTGTGTGDSGDEDQDPDALRDEAAEIGDPVETGDITWTVTDAEQETEFRSFAERKWRCSAATVSYGHRV